MISPKLTQDNSQFFNQTALTNIFAGPGFGTWDIKGQMNLYASYIYENGEESRLLDFSKENAMIMNSNESGAEHAWGNADTSGFNNPPLFVCSITINAEDMLNGPKCKGFAFYWNDSGDATSTKYFLAEASLEKGIRAGLTSSYTPWIKYQHKLSEEAYGDGKFTHMLTANFGLFDEPKEITYESRNGYRDDEDLCYNWKTAVFINRRLYVGNVYVNGEVRSDTMLKSPANKPSILPFSRRVDVVVGDGDSIVVLTEFADRLLQFKEKVMYIINVSGSAEYLEEKHDYKGVKHPKAVCKTDYGIIWVNNNGCYAYDGENVQNLLEKEKSQLISPTDWSNFTTDNSIVGYSAKEGHIVVIKDCEEITNTDDTSEEMYIYDIVTESWSYNNRIAGAPLCTNFANDESGNLIIAEKGSSGIVSLKSYSGKPTSTDANGKINFLTKDFDFGNPAVRKKVYKVYVTYTASADTNVTVTGYINGRPSSDTDQDVNMDSNLTTTSGIQSTLELKPTSATKSLVNNVYSFQLKFDGDASYDFEINDISIVYRIKNVK